MLPLAWSVALGACLDDGSPPLDPPGDEPTPLVLRDAWLVRPPDEALPFGAPTGRVAMQPLPPSHEAVLLFGERLLCRGLRVRAVARIERPDGSSTPAAFECGTGAGASSSELRVRVPTAALPPVGAFAVAFELRDDPAPDVDLGGGRVAQRAGVSRAAFWVAADVDGARRPRITRFLPRREAPGWSRPLVAADVEAYLAEEAAPLAPAEPLAPHDVLRAFGAERSLGIPGVPTERDTFVHVAGSARLADLGEGDDFGDGVQFVPGPPGLAEGARSVPFSEFHSATARGLLPGRLYDLRLHGLGRLPFGSVTQAPSGAVVVPWTEGPVPPCAPTDDPSSPVVCVERADVRFVFRTSPVRIERVGDAPVDTPVGPGSLVGVGADARLPVEIVIPDEDGVPAYRRFDVTVSFHLRGGRVETRTLAGPLPFASTDPITGEPTGVESVTADTLVQAGLRLPVVRVRLLVPVPPGPALSGVAELVVVTRLTGANAFDARDVVTRAADFDAPRSAPGTVCIADGSDAAAVSAPCTEVVDTDERDCRIDHLCVPFDADAHEVEVRLCGASARAPLRAVPRPDGSVWLCAAAPLDGEPSSGRPAAGRGAQVEVVVRDRSGNTSDVVTLAPPCFPVPERWVGPGAEGGAHARDVGGFPVTMQTRGPVVSLERWTGRWVPVFEHRATDEVYRGRVVVRRLADGSLAFCASRRRAAGGVQTRADLEQPGAVDVVHLRRDGAVERLEVARARALGCALGTSPDGRTLHVAHAAPTPGGVGPPVPRLAELALTAGRLAPRSTRDVVPSTDGAPLPLDLDVAVSALGVVGVVGRGLLSADGRVQEGSVWLATTREAGLGALTARRLGAQSPEPDPLGGFPIACPPGEASEQRWFASPRLVWAGAAPRVIALRSRATATSTRVGNLPACQRSAATTELVSLAAPGGRASALLPVAVARGLPRPAFPGGRFDVGSVVEPEVPPPFDVQEEVPGSGLVRVAYAQRPYGTDLDDLFPRGGLPFAFATATPSAFAVAEVTVTGVRGALRGAPTRVDVELGGRDASRVASLWLDPVARPLGRTASGALVDAPATVEASVLFDRVVPQVTTATLYAEERGGQFLGLGATPLGAAGTCWEQTFGPGRTPAAGLDADGEISRVGLDAEQLSLQTRPPRRLGDWSSVRLRPLDTNENQQSSDGLECIARRLAEDILSRREGDAYVPIDPEAHRDLTRSDVFGHLLGVVYAGDRATARATLESARHDLPPSLSGDLVLDVGGAVRRAVVPPGGGDVVARLDEALQRAYPARNVRAHVFRIENAEGREAAVVDGVAQQRLVLAARAEAAGVAPTLTVLGGSLASALGWAPGATARVADLDAAHGDAQDRFRPCNQSCVPGPRGNCAKPRDCLPSDRPLLASVFDGVRLRLDRPPLRAQSNVCVPASARERRDADVCAAPYGGGIASSYPSVRVPAVRPRRPVLCPDGAHAVLDPGSGEAVCATCGLPQDGRAPAGAVRTCETDDDCASSRPACRGADCPFDPERDYLCTKLTVPYMGQPPGTGVCARPWLGCRPEERFDRTVGRFTYLAGGSRPPATARLCPSPRAERPGIDFEPAPPGPGGAGGVECTLAGCAACTGATSALGDGTNAYCHADVECPVDHVCLDPGGTGTDRLSPMCLARPLLGDGRLREIARDLASDRTRAAGAREYNLRFLRDDFLPVLQRAHSAVGEGLRAARLPARVVPPQDGTAQVAVTALDARLRGAWVEVAADSTVGGMLPGGGYLVLAVRLSGLSLDVHAEFDDYSGPVRLGLREDDPWLRVALVPVPVLSRDAAGPRASLRFRVASVGLFRAVRGRGFRPLTDEDVDVAFPGDPWTMYRFNLLRLLSFIDRRTTMYGPPALPLTSDTADLGPLGLIGAVVGDVVTGLLDDSPVLALFGGADSSALVLGRVGDVTLTGVATERAPVLEMAAVTRVDATRPATLDLRYRGRRTATRDLENGLRLVAPALCGPASGDGGRP